jgi:multiple sugar transport system permease protein
MTLRTRRARTTVAPTVGTATPGGLTSACGDKMTRLARKIAGEGSFYAAVITLVAFAAFPFYWMLITTFKTDGDLYNLKSNPYWFNAAPTLEHLRYLFEDTLFVQWLWNTALIGACVVAITLAVAVPAGYSLARAAAARISASGSF